ncbi:phospholipase A and acyltransferase 3-like [Pseudoliparis swirei]|uniref:phospholipase A and acyltransferase 3-like n=1 Tax=Pseudoliparis swirei TaxID=2059687 RepID=UPI0024BE1E64|nr:phospholipase A and acyltransferase 3-like [Pseudoliparis swirei]XP_056294690.1 phospholipase A and acyltransferase 3-like [Pseudoliparis swirei]XP_056294692.1 phospholipase A and acyltransferase 3-like [Pseudoliparis swirei]XP_056294693.1 phospholipase A and acyltransferase 3-like [Pseudoliparis swirei]
MAPTLYDEKPEVGDLIEIFRGSYQHWAVYVGDGFIVHLAPPSEVPGSSANRIMSVVAEKALVKKEELWDVVGSDRWEINNSLDEKYKSRPAHVIVREACAKVGEEMPFCVFRGNCEHFATEMRYGKAESRQVRKAGETVAVAGLATAVFLGIAYMFSGSKKENKNTE